MRERRSPSLDSDSEATSISVDDTDDTQPRIPNPPRKSDLIESSLPSPNHEF